MTCDPSADETGSPMSGCIPLAVWQYGLVTSIFAIGGLFGALASAPLGNRYGRKKTLLLNTTGFILGGLLKALSSGATTLALGRFISGLSAGAAAVVVPLYVNEIAPPEQRGQFGAVTQVSINLGIVTTQVLGLFMSRLFWWRIILFVGAGIGTLQAVLLLKCPESPKYLISIGDKAGAREAAARLRGENHNGMGRIEDEIREEEEEPLHSDTTPLSPTNEEPTKVTMGTFLTAPAHRKSALIVCGLMLAQQLSGINAVIFHGVSVLSKLLPNWAGALNVLISASNLFITIAASTLFDKVSHKTLLLVSMLGMAASSFAFAIGLNWSIAALSAVGCFMFVSCFSIGLGPLPWMVAGRVVRYEAQDAAQASGLVVNWMGTFLVTFVVPLVPKVFAFTAFGVIGTLSALLVSWGVEAY